MGGRVRLVQPVDGYRAGLDAALLAAAVELAPGERALEAGCGAGAALLQVAARNPGATLVGLERDAHAADLARGNVARNGASARIVTGEIEAGPRALALTGFDAAFANPPFFDDPAAIRGPAPARRGAWIADAGLAAWCAFLLDAVRDGGRVTLVHRADRLADLFEGLAAARGGSLQTRPIHPFADAPAKRVLVRAIRGGRAPLALLPPLVLHAREGAAKHTAEADAAMRGEAALDWR